MQNMHFYRESLEALGGKKVTKNKILGPQLEAGVFMAAVAGH